MAHTTLAAEHVVIDMNEPARVLAFFFRGDEAEDYARFLRGRV